MFFFMGGKLHSILGVAVAVPPVQRPVTHHPDVAMVAEQLHRLGEIVPEAFVEGVVPLWTRQFNPAYGWVLYQRAHQQFGQLDLIEGPHLRHSLTNRTAQQQQMNGYRVQNTKTVSG